MTAPSFTCPVCGATSYHPEDIRQGYCGRCHRWTGRYNGPDEAPRPLGLTDGQTIALHRIADALLEVAAAIRHDHEEHP